MVENSFAVSAFCICSAMIAVLLRQYCREQSLLLALAACAAVMGGCFLFIGPMVGEVSALFSEAGISDSYISLIFKGAAICFITQMTCDICRDSGELAIASAAQMWGRAAVTFLSMPILKALIELIKENLF